MDVSRNIPLGQMTLEKLVTEQPLREVSKESDSSESERVFSDDQVPPAPPQEFEQMMSQASGNVVEKKIDNDDRKMSIVH